MNVCVRLPALFADRIDGLNRIDVSASNVEDALRAVAAGHPNLETLILDRSGAINPVVVIFHNDRQLTMAQLQAAVEDGDEIEIVPAIEGGSGHWDAPTSISSAASNNNVRSQSTVAHRRSVPTSGVTTASCVTTPLVTTLTGCERSN